MSYRKTAASVAVLAVAFSLMATAASAMTVREFLTTAAGIPRNPTAMLRADTRRLIGEVRSATRTVRTEQETAQAAGRRAATCMPDNVSLNANEILTRMNGVPAARRNISVTQAMREWMAERYPCPA